jgi:hypothetical protein
MSRSVALLLATVALAGCMRPAWRPDAFGPGRRMAVVTISSGPKVEYVSETRTLSSFFTMAAGARYSDDARPYLEETRPLVLKALGATGKFALVPEKAVLASGPYRATAEDDPSYVTRTLQTAKGYKFLKEESKLAALARGLHVDGALAVRFEYGYGMNGVHALGLISAGVLVARTTVMIGAYDGRGQLVWVDYITVTSDGSIPTVGEAANFDRLHPLILEATRKGIDALMQRLAEHV